MAQQHENRRIRMTKRLLKDALLELMQEHDLINISVTAICETADVHRSTFYNYYTNPADLFREIEQEFLDRVPVPPQSLDVNNQKELLAATTKFFDYIQDNKITIRTLFRRSAGNDFTERLVEYLCNGYVPVGETADEVTSRFTQLYIANGTVGMMREWVNEDFPVSNEKIADMMYSLSRKISQY